MSNGSISATAETCMLNNVPGNRSERMPRNSGMSSTRNLGTFESISARMIRISSFSRGSARLNAPGSGADGQFSLLHRGASR